MKASSGYRFLFKSVRDVAAARRQVGLCWYMRERMQREGEIGDCAIQMESQNRFTELENGGGDELVGVHHWWG